LTVAVASLRGKWAFGPPAYSTEPTVAVEIAVSDVFDQTPGLGAGKKIGK
jgi:hypothetical protein